MAADPTRFVVTFEARVPAAFLRAEALVVLAPADELLIAFRDPADVERALPAALFFAADPARFVVAVEVWEPVILARRLGPEATWDVSPPAALLAPVLDRVGLLAAALETLPEEVCLAGLRGFSSAGVFAIWSPHLLDVAASAILSLFPRIHAARRRATRQMSNGAQHRIWVLREDLAFFHFVASQAGNPVLETRSWSPGPSGQAIGFPTTAGAAVQKPAFSCGFVSGWIQMSAPVTL